MEYSYEKYIQLLDKYKNLYKTGKRKKEGYIYWAFVYQAIENTMGLFPSREEAIKVYEKFILSWKIDFFLDLFELLKEDDVYTLNLFLPGYWGRHSVKNKVFCHDLFAGILLSNWKDTITQDEFLHDFVYILLNNTHFLRDYQNKDEIKNEQ